MILELSLPELDIHGPLPAMSTLTSNILHPKSVLSQGLRLLILFILLASVLHAILKNAGLADACFNSLEMLD